MLLCIFDLLRIVCVLQKRNKGIGPVIFIKKYKKNILPTCLPVPSMLSSDLKDESSAYGIR
jgi:hypothetical protein